LRELETNIICLPGVPQELEAITDESILPMIKKGQRYIDSTSRTIPSRQLN